VGFGGFALGAFCCVGRGAEDAVSGKALVIFEGGFYLFEVPMVC